MAINYANLAALAERLIGEDGRDVTLQKRSRSASNPSQPWRGNTADVDTSTVKGVILDYESRDVDGATIRAGDKRLLVAASADTVTGEQIEDYDEVVDDSRTYKIMRAELIEPGDTRLLYDIQLRK